MNPLAGLALLCGLLFTHLVAADALIRSEAMFAKTIAEIYVEEAGIRVELEVGLDDIGSFRNLLPDAIYEGMDFPSRPYAERLAEFFASDLVIAGDQVMLPGELRAIAPRTRIVRDNVTGEELPVVEDDAETVVAAELFYPFVSGRPASLAFSPPLQFGMVSIGFVVYHNTVAVNDFRYLTRGMVLDLDWDDPWYSTFRTRNMRRSYFAPMSGFLYVEPFEVRKEIILRPKDIQRWVDVGLEGATVIAADQRGLMLEKIAAFLMDKQPVTINGEPVSPILDRVNFLTRTLKSSMVVEPGIDINIDSAVVGVIFVYPTSGLPAGATMTWDMFDERVQKVPASAVDEAGPLPIFLEPDYAVLEWQNFLTNPTIPGLVELAVPPSTVALWLYKLRWWFLAAAIMLLLLWTRGRLPVMAVAATVALLLVGTSFVAGRPLAPPDQATETVVKDLLRNVYQAFDYREESAVYDTLERSVGGDLLTDIYLETRRSLELTNQGGARAKVKSVELQAIEILPAVEPSAFRARATWNVNGSVGHWGHVHTRSNQYQAELLIQAIGGRWKLIAMNVLQEQRL
ncbi:MAG: hypothetical protein V7700_01575 [Halioglobus sp.]